MRTVTGFVVLARDPHTWTHTIASAITHIETIRNNIETAGYTVQTLRLVTNPFGKYLDTSSQEAALRGMQQIQEILSGPAMPNVRVRFAIGEARTAEELQLLPIMIAAYGDICNACINIEADALGIPDTKAIRAAAKTVQQIAETTDGGEGNFNFTVNFNCPPLIPYFPAGYHRSVDGMQIVLGLETPDLLVEALKEVRHERPDVLDDRNTYWKKAHNAMSRALQHHIDRIAPIVQMYADTNDVIFAGVDTSTAPSKDCSSMADVYKLLGVEYFGTSATLSASALLTSVFKSITGIKQVGFSGLMLAVTEDTGLANGTINNEYDISTLLMNSAVCGIGLDTVPIPGDVSINKIANLMQDTGTLAFRLNKPLTVRLFPVPSHNAGDRTSFTSDDLCNCHILSVV